jgi:hypothetical protein
MKSVLVIKDIPNADVNEDSECTLTPEQMKRLRGGRSVPVTVDGRPGGTVDDFDINTAIFEGRIKGPYIN